MDERSYGSVRGGGVDLGNLLRRWRLKASRIFVLCISACIVIDKELLLDETNCWGRGYSYWHKTTLTCNLSLFLDAKVQPSHYGFETPPQEKIYQ